MARLLALLANRPDLTARLLACEPETFSAARREGESWGWGLGFHHHGELLLKRRPVEASHALTLGKMLGDVVTDLVIASIQPTDATTAHSSESTAPFRYQDWLFTASGTIGDGRGLRAQVLESLPEFLRRNLRSNSDNELIFHLFLSFLHDAGKLEHPGVLPRAAFAALAATRDLLLRFGRESSGRAPSVNALLATPEAIFAARFGGPLAYRVLSGRAGVARLFAGGDERRLPEQELESCRVAMVASDFEGDVVPEEWIPVADGAMLALTRTDALHEDSPLR